MIRHFPIVRTGRLPQSGVSLIELMVALVIASLLGIGLVQIFGGTRAAFNSNSALARAQENSRFILGFISDDLRHVGHLGTRNEQGASPGAAEDPVGNNLFNHLATASSTGLPTDAPWAFRLDVPIEVYEFNGTGIGDAYTLLDPPVAATANGNWTPALPAELNVLVTGTDAAIAGSDVIVVRYLSPEYVNLVNTVARPDGMAVSTNLPFASGSGTFFWRPEGNVQFIQNEGIYAFSNANVISLFQVNGVGSCASTAIECSAVALGGLNGRDWGAARPRGLNGEQENPAVYGSLIPVHRYHMVVYYVAAGADGQPALFRRRLAPGATDNLGIAEELVPGVESLQVVMGVVNQVPRNSDHPLVYMTADEIDGGTWTADVDTRWRGVVNARVGVLMRSQSPSASAAEADVTRDVAGVLITPAATDRRLRQAYETQVAFRNRSRG